MITVGRYLNPVDAELDRIKLEQAGIPSFVKAGAEFNPLIVTAGGETSLEVDPGDAEAARKILRAIQTSQDDDAEGEVAVRCPACESEYCWFEGPTQRGVAAGANAITLAAAVLTEELGKQRWTCRTCGHRWDHEHAGPRTRTKLAADDPVPVFRLRRNSLGMGLFLGVVAGFLGAVLIGGTGGAAAFLALPFVGIIIGLQIRSDVCSERACREPAPPGVEVCAGCGGVFSGVIERADDHHRAALDAKRAILHDREVAAARKAERRARKKGKKPKESEAAPIAAPSFTREDE